MSRVRAALRAVLAVVIWWMVLYPAIAIFGIFVFPPDPSFQLFVVVPGLVLAVIAGFLFVLRSGSLRQLGRFAIAVFVILIVIVAPINAVLQSFGGFRSLLAVVTALILVGVCYGVGYYLIYENGYERAKARFVGSGLGE